MGIGTGDKEPCARALKLQGSIRAFASSYLADNMFTLPGLPSQDKYDAMLKEKDRARDRIKEEKLIAAANSKTNSLKRGVTAAPNQKSQTLGHNSTRTGFNNNELNPNNTGSLRRSNTTGATRQYTGEKTSGDDLSDNGDQSFFKPAQNFIKSLRGDYQNTSNKQTRSAVHTVSISKPTETSWGPAQTRVDDHSDPVIQQIQIIEGYLKQARDDGRWEEAQMFEINLQELRSVQSQNR